jgi:hypothetical protein
MSCFFVKMVYEYSIFYMKWIFWEKHGGMALVPDSFSNTEVTCSAQMPIWKMDWLEGGETECWETSGKALKIVQVRKHDWLS